jgi:prepilin-type N-terminal cleavage/methylation domain-containing protein
MCADVEMSAGFAAGDQDRSEAGFTLLEVVVAAAIAALALVALFQTGSAGLFTAGEATRVAEAVDRAQSHLAAIADAGTITPGEIAGDDGGGYHWRLSARPIASQQASTPGPGAAATTLYDIRVTVSWGGRRHPRSVELESRRIAGGGAQQ